MLAPAPLQSFGISAALVGNEIQVSVPTQAGHGYTVWQADSLQPANWTQVGGALVGDGTVQVVSQTASGGQEYYRVVAQ